MSCRYINAALLHKGDVDVMAEVLRIDRGCIRAYLGIDPELDEIIKEWGENIEFFCQTVSGEVLCHIGYVGAFCDALPGLTFDKNIVKCRFDPPVCHREEALWDFSGSLEVFAEKTEDEALKVHVETILSVVYAELSKTPLDLY